MLHIEFELLFSFLKDLILGLLEFVRTAGLGGEGKLLLFRFLVALADHLGLLLATLILFSLDLCQSLFE
jgi:hypothetical protein